MSTVILVDMDGDLCNYNERILSLAHTRLGLRKITEDEVDRFDVDQMFGEEYADAVDAFSTEQGFYSSLSPMPYAIEALLEMYEVCKAYQANIFICTAPKKPKKNLYCASEKLEWVQRYLGEYFSNNTILSRDKTLITGTILIDDKPVVKGVCKPSWEHVRFGPDYNEGLPNKRLPSWHKWKDVIVPMLDECLARKRLEG